MYVYQNAQNEETNLISIYLSCVSPVGSCNVYCKLGKLKLRAGVESDIAWHCLCEVGCENVLNRSIATPTIL